MEIVFISIGAFLFAFLLMSLGYIIMKKRIAGSCGGLNALFGNGACDVCENRSKCLEKDKD